VQDREGAQTEEQWELSRFYPLLQVPEDFFKDAHNLCSLRLAAGMWQQCARLNSALNVCRTFLRIWRQDGCRQMSTPTLGSPQPQLPLPSVSACITAARHSLLHIRDSLCSNNVDVAGMSVACNDCWKFDLQGMTCTLTLCSV
jgi:hypothetical protein